MQYRCRLCGRDTRTEERAASEFGSRDLDALSILASRAHRRSLFVAKLFANDNSSMEDLLLPYGGDGDPCGACISFINAEIEDNMRAAMIEKQDYLQQTRQLIASPAAPRKTKSTSDDHPPNATNADGATSEQCVHSQDATLMRLRKTYNRTSEMLRRTLTAANDVEGDIDDTTSRLVRCQALWFDSVAESERLQAHNPELLRARGYRIKTMAEHGCPDFDQALVQLKQFSRHSHKACATVNDVHFGFVLDLVNSRSQHSHRFFHFRSASKQANNNKAIREINIAWGMVTSLVASLQRYVVEILEDVTNQFDLSRVSRDLQSFELEAPGILAKLRMVTLIEAGSRSRIAIKRTSQSSALFTEGKRQWSERQYDLFLRPGQSRMSFSFGMMAVVKLVNRISRGLVVIHNASSKDHVIQPLSWHGSELGGEALSFLDADFEQLHFEAQTARPDESQTHIHTDDPFSVLLKWNCSLDKFLQRIQASFEVAANSPPNAKAFVAGARKRALTARRRRKAKIVD